jgi:predicted transcriptional regulator
MIHYEGQEKACNFTLRMPQLMRDKVQEIADREHITPTYFIRQLIEQTLRGEEERKKLEKTSA